ncbi:MAG: Fe-Mn family superoxide dismutase [Campylobacterota bacterium]|nr:Fe-Mn family superoxide dismutase [Campylobacterota bacterium]
MNRRNALTLGGIFAASSMLHAEVKQTIKVNMAYGANHEIKPLPFDPKSLQGISEKVIVSHHDNNYAGAVKKLRLIQKQISLLPDTAHPIEYGALKREELIALNSKILHELYFDNLGGKGSVSEKMKKLLSESFGSYEMWQKDFIQTAKSLSGGSGWVILGYVKEAGVLINQISSDHSDNAATSRPLLVMDMYEHSYHMDYGTKADQYIDSFLKNVNWENIEKRWDSV